MGTVLGVAACVCLLLNRKFIISFLVVIHCFFSIVMKLVAQKRQVLLV